MSQQARKWLPQPEIDSPCADISYEWRSGEHAALVVTMHFSRIVDGLATDLELTFDHPLAVSWEDESFGLVESPAHLPKCSSARFRRYAHPTLVIDGSPWAARYAARKYAENDPDAAAVTHYFLVSLNDLLHILAERQPRARWILHDEV